MEKRKNVKKKVPRAVRQNLVFFFPVNIFFLLGGGVSLREKNTPIVVLMSLWQSLQFSIALDHQQLKKKFG